LKNKLIMLVGAVLMTGACAQLPRIDVQAHNNELMENQEIERIRTILNRAEYEQSLQEFRRFEAEKPQSMYFQAARLGEAESLAGLERHGEAATMLRDIYLKTVRYQPEIAARAMYQLSFAYEAEGDDAKTIASLLDAQKLSQHLPRETARAEIPARLAMVYGKSGREVEARSYLSQADRGLMELMTEEKLGDEWLAKTYYQMGSVSTAQVSTENYSSVVQGQKMVQVYLFRSMALNKGVWSQKSLAHLKSTYRDLFSQLNVSAPVNAGTAAAEQREMGAELVDLINQAELYKPVNAKQTNGLQKDFFSYLTGIKVKTEALLYQTRETMTLTPESEKLNSLKREGRMRGPMLLPAKVVPSEDPNL
jgi:hypothetical protein